MAQVIVVALSGWVFVGEKDESVDHPNVFALKEAGVIRRWGTTSGLGQLCLSGSTKETIVDPVGKLQVPAHSVVAVLDVQAHTRVYVPWTK